MTVLKIMIPRQDDWAPPHWWEFFHRIMVGLRLHRGCPGLPNMTEDERDSIPAIGGEMVYNTTAAEAQVYENGSWRQI